MNISITRHGAAELQRDHLALVAAFQAVFALDIAAAAQYVANLHRHARCPDFRCLLARKGDRSGPLLGFTYGYTSQPGQWYHDSLAPALGPERAARWLTGAFEFVEFGVIPEARRGGIGTRLHDSIFAGLPHSAAILSTPVDNHPAIAFYRRRGWEPLLADFRFPGTAQPYLILGRRLDNQRDPDRAGGP